MITMDDFGNSIIDFCRPGLAGFEAFVLCAECYFSSVFASEGYLRQMGVVL